MGDGFDGKTLLGSATLYGLVKYFDALAHAQGREARARAAEPGRGRDARNPAQIPPRGWNDILRRTLDNISHDRLGLIAAGVAFYALLALFPAIALAVALVGMVAQPQDFISAMDDASRIMPPEAAGIILGQAAKVAATGGGGLSLAALAGLLFAIWSASRGMISLIQGLNIAYGEREKRGFIRLNLTALALTLVLTVGLILGLTATVVIPAVLAVFAPGSQVAGLLALVRWPILIVGTILGLSVMYRFGPSREHARWSWLSAGAILACILWVVATAGFAFYVGRFGSYNETFGALGGVVVLLLWLWLSAFIILAGAELNGEIEAQTARDSTTGPELPMGLRGAVKADTLGPSTGG